MSRSIIVLPDDTAKPILDAIHGATESIRIKMFVFSDPSLIKAVIDAHKRGVDVRVMLNPARRDGERKRTPRPAKPSPTLAVEVIDSNPCFDLTHEKSMVIDDEHRLRPVAQLGDRKPHRHPRLRHRHHPQARGRRDHAVLRRRLGPQQVRHPATTPISSGASATAASASASSSTAPATPSGCRTSATRTPPSSSTSSARTRRGVKIHIMARPPHKLKKDKLIEGVSGLRILQDLGVKIHKLQTHQAPRQAAPRRRRPRHHRLHQPRPRQLRQPPRARHRGRRPAHHQAHQRRPSQHDWDNSHPLDLSDEGLLAELKEYDPNVKEDLAIGAGKHHKGK